MTKEQIDQVLERVRSWPLELQERAANVVLVLECMDTSLFPITEQDRLELLAAVEEMERGEVASPEEVAELYRLRRRG